MKGKKQPVFIKENKLDGLHFVTKVENKMVQKCENCKKLEDRIYELEKALVKVGLMDFSDENEQD